MSVEETVNPTALLTESKPYHCFSWKVSAFQQYLNNCKFGDKFYSSRFWHPNPISFKGNKLRDANEYISLYLEAIQTPYENQNLIDTRYARFKLSIEMMEISDDFTKTKLIKLKTDTEILEHKFIFNSDDDFGYSKFYSIKNFKREWKESNSETIKIHSFKYETFRAILFYIYSGKLVDTQDLELLKDVYVKAEMMGLDGLLKLLVNKFSEIIDEDNWDDILILGQRTKNIINNVFSSSNFSMDENKLLKTFIWFIKDFQHFYKNPTHCQTVWSGAFYSPCSSSSTINNEMNTATNIMTVSGDNTTANTTTIINHSTNNDIISNGCAWRLCMFPKGYKTEQFLSLFLYAFPTDYEKMHGIHCRAVRYVLELFKVGINPNTSKVELRPVNVGQTVFKKSFNLDHKGDSGGKVKFSDLTNLFPSNDTSIKLDIIIRLKLYTEDDLQANYNINNVDIIKFQPSLENYFNNNNFSDVTFSFNDESEIKASRLALSIRSSYFDRMFNGEWAESKATIIPIKNVTYQCFKYLIYFLYSGKLNDDIPFDVLKDLFIEADIREIPELGELVASKIIDQVSDDNWSEILFIGWKTKNYSLKNAALSYIRVNWEKIKRGRKINEVIAHGDMELIDELMYTICFGVILAF
ncbi:10819_t:CDS:2 [Entrophospora sp. SA101]|nr:10819_t:CDS:2 [Entrophospora sp. SA101]